MNPKIKNELGHRYGRLVVIGYTDERVPSNGCVKWECKCTKCGAISIHSGNDLRNGKVKGYCNKHNKRR